MTILAIESSCDETSTAVLENSVVLSNVISTQFFHKKFGGVIPELASRAHLRTISNLTEEALIQAGKTINQIDAIAVTREPGLIGALVVGSNFAKGLALRYNLPIVPINHIEGHLYSGGIEKELEFPYVSLVVSGGHTAIFYVKSYNEYEIMGLTKDDAAGEAFDKTAKLLGLPYPGGPHIDKLAKQGNSKAYDFPRAMINSNDYNFSFSGLKTSVRYYIAKNFHDGVPKELIPDFAASIQAAIVDVLVHKAIKAAIEKAVKTVVVAGGVSANSELRDKLAIAADKHNKKSVVPEINYCMDNAAMIGFLAQKKIEDKSKNFFDFSFAVSARALRAKKK